MKVSLGIHFLKMNEKKSICFQLNKNYTSERVYLKTWLIFF